MENEEVILEFLRESDSLSGLYVKIKAWLESNLDEPPLIFYQPQPVEDFSFGEPETAHPYFIHGDGSLEPRPIEKIKNNDSGLQELSNSLLHFTKNDRWLGAIESSAENLEVVEENQKFLVEILSHGIKFHHQQKQALVSDWYQQLNELLDPGGEQKRLFEFATRVASELLETSEAGYYELQEDNYKLVFNRGFEVEDKRSRRCIPRNHLFNLELDQSGPLIHGPLENSSTHSIYIPVQDERGRRDLIVAYGVSTELQISKLKKFLLQTLSGLIYFSLKELELINNRTEILYDPLTHLYTEDYFKQQLIQEVNKGKRYGLPCSLLMLEVNNLEKIMDDLGEENKTAILQELGRLLESCFRVVDIPGYFSETEFGILFPNTPLSEAREAAERFHSLVKNPIFEVEGKFVQIKICGGLVGYPQTGKNQEELLKEARLALYRAKQTDESSIVLADEPDEVPEETN